jgi:molybdate transport system substrate-binding protein
VVSGNAELGFIAYSQIHKDGKLIDGSYWLVPAKHYSQIRQNAVVLARGKGNAAVDALAGFLKSKSATDIIKSYGYDL